MISVYFMHESLTPDNVRLTWHVQSGADAPMQGDQVTAPIGQDGAVVTWVVIQRRWSSQRSIELTLAGRVK